RRRSACADRGRGADVWPVGGGATVGTRARRGPDERPDRIHASSGTRRQRRVPQNRFVPFSLKSLVNEGTGSLVHDSLEASRSAAVFRRRRTSGSLPVRLKWSRSGSVLQSAA